MQEDFYISPEPEKFARISKWGVPALSPTVNYGMALFEGMSIIARKKGSGYRLSFFHPMLNYERMKFGVDELGMNAPVYPMERHIKTVFQICALNGWNKKISLNGKEISIERANGEKYARIYVRPVVYSTTNSIGLGAKMDFTIMHALLPFGQYLKMENPGGIKTILYPKPRSIPFANFKMISNYPISISARGLLNSFNEKNKYNAEEAVFVNEAGVLTEGSGENILLLKDNELITPPVSAGALPGTTLRIVSKIAESLGVRFSFRTFFPKDIEKAETMFFTGNAAGMIPIASIAEIDEKFSVKKLHETEIGGRGELFKKINSLYESVVFGDDSFGDFSVYFDDWMSEEEADELEKEKRDSFSLNMKINPPEKWEKQKESVLKELGIGKFL
ncbi:MAG TPA: aminotransferase class IV [archaeon]|nr:aminotransferase class IV [archaeon]